MKGRYQPFKKASWVKVLWGTILLSAIARGALKDNYSDNKQQIIVRSSSYTEMIDFAECFDLSVSPLISYPDPSQEVVDMFSDYYLIDVSSANQSTTRTSLSNLKIQDWVQYFETNQVNTIDSEPAIDEAMGGLESELFPYSPNDPMFRYQWSKSITQTDWVWSLSSGNSDIVIAILDSGVDTDHPDLAQNITEGFNFIDDDTDVSDDNGHGTKVAGAAAARIDNSLGIAGTAGNASVMPLKVTNQMGNVSRSDLINAICYAADHGAKIINISAGFSGPSAPEEIAVEYAWGKGLLLCASAGNDGEYDEDHYPSTYRHVVSVGASNADDTRASRSNFGSNVDVYAPGKSVWMTLNGGSYGTGSGTSYASPQVAGLAALVWAVHPQHCNQEVFDAIVSTGDTIMTDQGSVLRINARKAVEFEPDSESQPGKGAVSETVHAAIKVSVPSVQNEKIKIRYQVEERTGYSVRLFDIAGKVVYIEDGEACSQGSIECNIRLPQGTYFWAFATDQEVLLGKVVLVR